MQSRALSILAGVLCSLCACGPGADFPIEDLCDVASNEEATTLQLGQRAASSTFVPWQAEAEVSPVFGIQGGEMIETVFRIEGTTSQCMEVRTFLTNADGETVGDERLNLRFYEQEDGSMATEPYFLLLYWPSTMTSSLTIEATIGGASQHITLQMK